jgi:hypothetical protein
MRTQNRLNALLFCALCFSLLATSLWVHDAQALDEQYAWAWARQLSMLIEMHPRYAHGGTTVQGGMDCTGYVGIAAKWAGMPVKRSTTIRMLAGFDGWLAKPVPLHGVVELDLVWFTIKRPNQHVGVVWDAEPGKPKTFTHSGSSTGVTVSDLEKGYWADKATATRRLTIGD